MDPDLQSDLERSRMEARTGFGAWQYRIVAVAFALAVVCGLASLRIVLPGEGAARVVQDGSWRQRLSHLQAMSEREYGACRVATLLDTPTPDRTVLAYRQLSRTPGLGFPTTTSVWSVVATADFTGVECRGPEWLGLGSQLDTLPVALQNGVDEGHALWRDGAPVTVATLAEEELLLWTKIHAEHVRLSDGPVENGLVVRPPVGVTEAVAAPIPLTETLLLALLAAALLVFGVAIAGLPDRVLLELGTRGVTIGTRRIPRHRIRALTVEDGRLRIELTDGTTIRSPVLLEPGLQPLVDAWNQLERPAIEGVPVDVKRRLAQMRE